MRALFTLLCGLMTALAETGGALAAAGPWSAFEGGRARLIADDAAQGEAGRAFLQIELEPGWKTYWLEPGDGGVPPSVKLRIGGAPIEPFMTMPAPQRFREPNTIWAGYRDGTYIAMTFQMPDMTMSAPLEASAFLGICREICIPVSIDLAAPFDGAGETPPELLELETEDGLPLPFAEAGIAPALSLSDDTLTLSFQAPSLKGASGAELFVREAPSGLRLGAPAPASAEEEGRLTFELPIRKQKTSVAGQPIELLLALGDRSYSGTMTLPETK